MSLVIDASSPAVKTSVAFTATTASFTPPDGALLVVAFSGNSTGGANPAAPTITDSLGAHLTYALSNWRSRADSSPAGINGQVAMWTAAVGTGVSMTVSVTCALAELAVKVWVITGADPSPIGTSGEAASASASAISQSYTAAATSGQGFAVACDWDAGGTMTAGSGCTVDAGNVATQFDYAFVNRSVDDDTVGVSNLLSVTLPGSSTNLSWCWVELVPLAINQINVDPPPFVMFHPPGWGSPDGGLNPWLGATDAPGQPITMAVTAIEGGSTFNGMSLAVKMVTGAAVPQPGATNSTTTITTPSLAITPAATGSWVYGAILDANGTTAWTELAASTPFVINAPDVANGSTYGNYRSTGTTTGGTPVTLGASAPTGLASGGLAQAEIRPLTILVEDPASPPPITTFAATTVTTATFTTVPGALLVATVCADGGVGVCTMTLTGGGLTWVELVKANGTGKGYAGVWAAQVPGGAVVDTPIPAPLVVVAGRPGPSGVVITSAARDTPAAAPADTPTVALVVIPPARLLPGVVWMSRPGDRVEEVDAPPPVVLAAQPQPRPGVVVAQAGRAEPVTADVPPQPKVVVGQVLPRPGAALVVAPRADPVIVAGDTAIPAQVLTGPARPRLGVVLVGLTPSAAAVVVVETLPVPVVVVAVAAQRGGLVVVANPQPRVEQPPPPVATLVVPAGLRQAGFIVVTQAPVRSAETVVPPAVVVAGPARRPAGFVVVFAPRADPPVPGALLPRPLVVMPRVRPAPGVVWTRIPYAGHDCFVVRPGSGLLVPADTGVVLRPDTGLVAAGGGIVVRPFTGVVINEC